MARAQHFRRLIGISAAALLTGCAVGPNFHSPAIPGGDSYAMPGDDPNTGALQTRVGDKVIGDWWALFQSPALDQVMREAIAGSPTLDLARARLAQAKDAAGAQGGLLTADLTGGIKRERANLNAFSGGAFSGPGLTGFPSNPEFNLYSIGATVSYNLDLFGGQKRLRESLAAQTEAQAHELDAAYLTLTGKVIEQALIIADASAQAARLQAIADDDQKDLDMISRAHTAGGASDADVAEAQGQLARDSALLPTQRQRLAVARHAMAVLVGKSPSEWSPPDFDMSSGVLPTALPVSLPSALVRQRPDILEAEAKLHAATAQIGVATANLYPNITLSGSLAQDALSPETLFDPIATSWAVGAGVTAPLFHSGELHARERQAEAAARAALASYKETVIEAFAQVDDVLQAVAHDNQAYEQQTRALEAASRRLDMARRGFAAGGVSAHDLLGAQQTLRRAAIALEQRGVSRYADAAMLLLAVAGAPQGAADPGQPAQGALAAQ